MKKSVFSFIAEFFATVALIISASCGNNNPLTVKKPVLAITRFSPTSGLIGSYVDIYGDQFIPTVSPDKGVGPYPNTSIVAFNGTVAEAGYVYQDNIGKQHINTKVPAGATNGKITVTSNGNTVSSTEDFLINMPVLVITRFSPSSGLIGSYVGIYGGQFIPTVPPDKGLGPYANTSIVAFNGTVAEAGNVYQDSIGNQYFNTKVPAGATSGKITVTSNGNTVSSTEDFFVTIPIYLPNVVVTTVPAWGEGIAIDREGNLYATHNDSREIVKITPDGNVHTLWSSATDAIPWGIAVDAKGNVFATVLGSYILRIDADGKVTTLAGSTDSGDVDGQGASARFSFPFGIAVDKDGNLYVADMLNHKIRKITSDGTVSTLAGSTQGFKDGTGTNAQFGAPSGINLDAEGNVYVTDGDRIRKVSSSGQVSTVAGSTSGYLDGTTANAQFNGLTGIVIDTSGNLYLCDMGNYVVRRIAPDGTVVTVAGSTPGYLDGPGPSAQFVALEGITMDASGAFYLAQDAGPIRKIVIH